MNGILKAVFYGTLFPNTCRRVSNAYVNANRSAIAGDGRKRCREFVGPRMTSRKQITMVGCCDHDLQATFRETSRYITVTAI